MILGHLREDALQSAEADLARHTLLLAEQTGRSFQSLDLVLSRVGDYLGGKGINDVESYHRIVTDRDTHNFLREKITGLAEVDAVTLIDDRGRLLNFSRYWPIPAVNVADRDYFKALWMTPAAVLRRRTGAKSRRRQLGDLSRAAVLTIRTASSSAWCSARFRCGILRISSAPPRSAKAVRCC